MQNLASPLPPSVSDIIQSLHGVLAEQLATTNQLLVHHMQSDVPMIPELAGHIIASGGKRVRPLLTLSIAEVCGYGFQKNNAQRHAGLAAAVECIHTATLLHDDVVDESAIRRGKPSANALFGNQASVLVGDFLFSRAFQLMVADNSLQTLGILSEASAKIAEGEVLQLSIHGQLDIPLETYLKVIQAKTAVLFGAACHVGAVVAGVSEAQQKAAKDFGIAFGMAFQIIDDILDYAGGMDWTKTAGDDFREGKVTLPVLLAYQNGREEDRMFWQKAFTHSENEDLATEILLEAQRRLQNSGVFNRARDIAEGYTNAALTALKGLPEEHTLLKNLLADLVTSSLNRTK